MLIKRHRSYTAAASLLLTGLTLASLGIVSDTLPETIAGVVLCIFGQTVACMRILRGWITNTTAEKAQLQHAAQHLDDQAQKHAAGKLALHAEIARIRSDRIAAAARADEARRVERERLQAQFDEQRAELISDAFEVAWKLYNSGEPDAARAAHRVVVQFPTQPADHERARARSRDVNP